MANGNLPFPFPDAVSQFSVESTVLGAQDGMHSGGLVNVVTRSGTNVFHGSAFEFIRNNFIDATNFFATCTPLAPATTCTAKDTLHQNQYGGTFGGRIIRDKLFGFAAYQRLSASQSTAATKAQIPTAANLLGDFSTTDPPPGSPANTCAKPVQLVDPLTGATIPGNKYATPPTFNASSLALLKFLPKIDPSYDTGNCGFVSYAIPNQQSDNEFVTRVDWTINAKHHFYARYFIDGYQFPAFFSQSNAFLANQVSTVYPNAPAGTFYYGDKGVPRAFTEASPWQFSPNVGIAYDLNGRGTTVIRGGFELIYDQVNFFTGQRTQQNPPFATAISQSQTSTSGPISFASPWSVGQITTSPFPQPPVPTPSQAQFFPQSQYIVLPTQFKPPYTEQWTASVQHQFPHDWQMQLNYIGNHTLHDPTGTPLSPAVYVPGNWGAGGTGCPGVVTTGPAGKPAGAVGTPCSTVANQTQRFALTAANPAQGNQYLGGGGGSVLVNDIAMANYNGMIASVQHRLSSTFSMLANYTFSKCLGIADAQGDYAATNVENPNTSRSTTAPAALTSATSRTSSSSCAATSTRCPRSRLRSHNRYTRRHQCQRRGAQLLNIWTGLIHLEHRSCLRGVGQAHLLDHVVLPSPRSS